MEYNKSLMDHPGFLYLNSDTSSSIHSSSSIRRYIIESSPDESWEATASRMTQEGIPCECVFENGWCVGILFKDPKQKLEFILKCK